MAVDGVAKCAFQSGEVRQESGAEGKLWVAEIHGVMFWDLSSLCVAMHCVFLPLALSCVKAARNKIYCSSWCTFVIRKCCPGCMPGAAAADRPAYYRAGVAEGGLPRPLPLGRLLVATLKGPVGTRTCNNAQSSKGSKALLFVQPSSQPRTWGTVSEWGKFIIPNKVPDKILKICPCFSEPFKFLSYHGPMMV